MKECIVTLQKQVQPSDEPTQKPETAHVDSQKMCNSLTAKYEAAQPKKAHKPQSESTESREVISDSNPKATQTTAQQLKSVSVEADD